MGAPTELMQWERDAIAALARVKNGTGPLHVHSRMAGNRTACGRRLLYGRGRSKAGNVEWRDWLHAADYDNGLAPPTRTICEACKRAVDAPRCPVAGCTAQVHHARPCAGGAEGPEECQRYVEHGRAVGYFADDGPAF